MNVTFEGEFSPGKGYESTRSTTELDTDSIRLPDGEQSFSSKLRLRSEITGERLDPAEQLALGL